MNQIYLQEGEDVISYVGNIHPDGTPYPWGNQRATSRHTDQSYIKTPVSAGILHCLQVPDAGGGTMFCNMYAAFDSLSDDNGPANSYLGMLKYNLEIIKRGIE